MTSNRSCASSELTWLEIQANSFGPRFVQSARVAKGNAGTSLIILRGLVFSLVLLSASDGLTKEVPSFGKGTSQGLRLGLMPSLKVDGQDVDDRGRLLGDNIELQPLPSSRGFRIQMFPPALPHCDILIGGVCSKFARHLAPRSRPQSVPAMEPTPGPPGSCQHRTGQRTPRVRSSLGEGRPRLRTTNPRCDPPPGGTRG